MSIFKTQELLDDNARLASEWAKKNCKTCHGRGRTLHDDPSRGVVWTQVCLCVRRNLEKHGV